MPIPQTFTTSVILIRLDFSFLLWAQGSVSSNVPNCIAVVSFLIFFICLSLYLSQKNLVLLFYEMFEGRKVSVCAQSTILIQKSQ